MIIKIIKRIICLIIIINILNNKDIKSQTLNRWIGFPEYKESMGIGGGIWSNGSYEMYITLINIEVGWNKWEKKEILQIGYKVSNWVSIGVICNNEEDWSSMNSLLMSGVYGNIYIPLYKHIRPYIGLRISTNGISGIGIGIQISVVEE